MLVPQNWLFYRIIKLIHREHNRGRDPDGSVTDAYGNPLEGIMVNFRGTPRWVTPASKRMLRVRQKFLDQHHCRNESNYS